MNRLLAVSTAGLATAALVATAATAQQDAPPLPPASSVRAPNCSLNGGKTMKANRSVRVFKRTRHGFGRVYGCRRSADRAFELGYAGECQNSDEIDKVEVAGRRAALGIFECSLTDGWWRVDIVNLRDGHREFTSKPITPAAGDEATDDVLQRIVVTPGGAVAWTAARSVRGVVTAVEVRRRVAATTTQSVVVDSGGDIDPDSLRKRGDRIIWTKAGARRSAPI